jgi:hypothetical protein
MLSSLLQNEFEHFRIFYPPFDGTGRTREGVGMHFMGKFDPQDFAPGLASKQSIEAKARSDN